MKMRRYWTLPIDEPVFFRKDDDYVDRFRELLDQAVDDRLRTKKIGVFMSGGLDSPAMAAAASRILRGRSAACEVRAFTTVIEGFDGNERHFARMVAEHLGIPIHFRDLTESVLDSDWAKVTSTLLSPSPIP
jgi:asparagine synthetase B (glutamine-hydrolysing)